MKALFAKIKKNIARHFALRRAEKLMDHTTALVEEMCLMVKTIDEYKTKHANKEVKKEEEKKD